MPTSGLDIKDLELNALLEITQAINNNLSEEDLFRIYKFTLLADLKVERLALYVLDTKWNCRVSFGTSQNWAEIELPESFRDFHELMELGQDDELFGEFDLAIPVLHKNRQLAVIFVGRGHKNYRGGDGTFLKALTNIIIVAIENKKLARKQLQQEAYRKEMEIAKKVQNFLIPNELPDSERLKIEAVYLPHQDVGGDYYDYIQVDDDRFLVCVADVSGKGVPAALLMSNFQASLRTLVRKTSNTKEIVEELNYIISQSGNRENFITFFLGIYSFQNQTFEYVNCGHNPLFIYTDNHLIELNDGTTVLGMFEPLPFLETKVISGLKQFYFFGYTDGLTETFNSQNEEFGEDRLIDFLKEGIPSDINHLHTRIFSALDDFRQDTSFKDDITMLSCVVSNP